METTFDKTHSQKSQQSDRPHSDAMRSLPEDWTEEAKGAGVGATAGGALGAAGGGVVGWTAGMTQGVIIGLVAGMFLGAVLSHKK